MLLELLAVLSTVHLEGTVPPEGGDYLEVAFEVPKGTVEIQIAHSDGDDAVILDWGVWSPDGFRGWGGGLTDDAIIGVEESSRGYLTGPLSPGTWHVVIGKAKLGPAGGHYTLDIECRDHATLSPAPRAPYEPVVLATERRWYKGDFHVHSEQSGDASATLDEIVALARARGLDFVTLSDHNTSSQLPLAAAKQRDTRDVLLLRGAEITTYAGHANAVGTSAYVDHRIGHQGRTIDGVLDDVAAQDAVVIVNHPTLDLGTACIGCAWAHDDTDWSRVTGLEVLTGKWEITERLLTPGALALWDAQLDAGYRIAAVGGSDDHRAGAGTGTTDTPLGSPTTLVLADELSEAAILDGLRRGRTIVMLRGPDDPMVEMTIGNAQIGDTVEDELSSAAIRVRVTGGAGTFAQLWRDGHKLDELAIDGDDTTHTFVDDTPGPHRYRIELVDGSHQRIVITSHIFATLVPDASGCCDAGSRGATGGLVPAALVMLALRRRRR